MRTNRAAHRTVNKWLPPKVKGRYGLHAGSINYGVSSAEAEAMLDTPIPYATTYTDLLAWLLLSLPAPTRYLEIGVSVGKNLHALTRTVAKFGSRTGDVTLYALDLERFNPMLVSSYPPIDATCQRWRTPAVVDDGSGAPTLKADEGSSVCEHTIADADTGTRMRLLYTSADLKTHAAWIAIAASLVSGSGSGGSDSGGNAFDLVFSDAWHAAAAVQWELRQLLGRQLLSRRAVVVWDDLNTPAMRDAFGYCCAELRRSHPAVQPGTPDSEDEEPDRIECFFSAVTSGFVVANHSDIIGIAGPARVLAASAVRLVLPSLLRLEDFGFTVPE